LFGLWGAWPLGCLDLLAWLTKEAVFKPSRGVSCSCCAAPDVRWLMCCCCSCEMLGVTFAFVCGCVCLCVRRARALQLLRGRRVGPATPAWTLLRGEVRPPVCVCLYVCACVLCDVCVCKHLHAFACMCVLVFVCACVRAVLLVALSAPVACTYSPSTPPPGRACSGGSSRG
jgi:hypothetical protein